MGKPSGRITNIIDHGSHRLTSVTDPDNLSTAFGYDGSLRLSTITSRNGATTTLSYDAQAGTLSSVTAPSVSFYDGTAGSPLTTYSAWQKVGVPYTATAPSPPMPPPATAVAASVTQPAGEITRFTVNRWGAPVQTTDALGGVTTTTYDTTGLPIK